MIDKELKNWKDFLNWAMRKPKNSEQPEKKLSSSKA